MAAMGDRPRIDGTASPSAVLGIDGHRNIMVKHPFGLERIVLSIAMGLSWANCAHAIRPSDCQARDADSTCNQAVTGGTGRADGVNAVLYDGSLGGAFAQGYAYWGYDFLGNANGTRDLQWQDMYMNRSAHEVTLRLTFDIPTNKICQNDCLPGIVFFIGPNWSTRFPPAMVNGGTVSMEQRVHAGESYGWAIGLWESTNPRLTVTVEPGVTTTLDEIGLPQFPAIADEIPAVTIQCTCYDSSTAACSLGSRFSNGLMGAWYRTNGGDYYARAGAFTMCNVH